MSATNTPPTLTLPAPGAGPSQMSARFTPIDPIRILRQYWKLLAATVVVGAVIGAGLHFVLLFTAPQYTAVAQVAVNRELEGAMGSYSPTNERLLEMFKLTQAYVIESDQVLSNALQNNIEARSTEWWKQFANPEERLEEMRDIVRVVPVRNTEVIEVRVTLDNKTEAAILSNAVLDTYMDLMRAGRRASGSERRTVLTSRRNDLQADVDRLRNRATEIVTEHELPVLQVRFDELSYNLQRANETYGELEAQLQIAQGSYQSLVEAKKRGDFEFSPEDEAQVAIDPTIKGRTDRLVAFQEELRVASERFGSEHRTVQDLERRLEATKVEMEREKQRLLSMLQDYKIAQAATAVASLEGQLATVEQTLASLREQKRELNARLVDYNNIEAELERKLLDLDQVSARLEELDLMAADPEAERVRIQARATTPIEPSFPRIEIMVPGVAALLLMIVGGIVFLRELLDQRIKSPSCVRLLPQTELLGCLPDIAEDPSGAASVELVVAREPSSVMTESFRQLRTEVLTRMHRGGHKTLMLAGSQPGSGVSSVVANLGASIALNGRKVLILDANFRVPSQHRTFNVPETPGFGDVLKESADHDKAIHSTDVNGLDVMPIGQAQQDVLESLEAPQCTKTLEELSARYDLVLIDAPPLSIVGDSRILAGYVDAFLLVVRAMADKRGLVSRLIRQFGNTRAEYLGLIINGIRSSAGGYYRRNYQQFYNYMERGQNSRGQHTANRQAAAALADESSN